MGRPNVKWRQHAAFAIALAGGATLPTLASAAELIQYEFLGQPGTETSVAASYVAAGLTGFAFTATAVTPVNGVNSINASGWNNPSASFDPTKASYNFGFGVDPGHVATVSQIVFGARSSRSGPGTINVYAVVDGGLATRVARFDQSYSNSENEYISRSLDIAALTALRSVAFSFVVDPDSVRASGPGDIASGGTFRIGDYNPVGSDAPTPFTVRGSVAGVAAVPEPSTWAMMIVGFGVAGGALRRRRATVRVTSPASST